ncbi:hypothetical protein [Caballeronia humi]|nr:hypothetical protein [Caballeronia humi]
MSQFLVNSFRARSVRAVVKGDVALPILSSEHALSSSLLSRYRRITGN